MKKIWVLVVTMLTANSMAVVGLVSWLALSGRMDIDRITKVREMFGETIDEQNMRLAEEEAQLQETQAQAENVVPKGLPRSASELVAMRLEATAVDRQLIERLRREVEDLQRKLRRDQSMLDSRARDFKKEREAFNAMRAGLAAIEGQEQFRKSVELVNSLKPADSKVLLDVLLNEGNQEQVVSYLDALEERSRSQIISEFIKDGQQDLAANLLESIRLRGLEAVVDGDITNGPGS